MNIEACRRTLQNRWRKQLEQREQRRQQVLETVLNVAPAIIARFPSIQRAYLFGSITRPGAFHAESDVDIGVEGASAVEYFAVWRALDEAFPEIFLDVRDVVPETYFGQQVQNRGILLYEREHPHSASGNSG